MAGIEKICEFSGDYPGYRMYGYKRNHIQICPKYRKLFRGAKSHIEIRSVTPRVKFKDGGFASYSPDDTWWDVEEHKVKNEYIFALVVQDSTLQGKVEGVYLNWTFDLKDTLKRLKRMLKCRNLKVVYKLEKE